MPSPVKQLIRRPKEKQNCLNKSSQRHFNLIRKPFKGVQFDSCSLEKADAFDHENLVEETNHEEVVNQNLNTVAQETASVRFIATDIAENTVSQTCPDDIADNSQCLDEQSVSNDANILSPYQSHTEEDCHLKKIDKIGLGNAVRLLSVDLFQTGQFELLHNFSSSYNSQEGSTAYF